MYNTSSDFLTKIKESSRELNCRVEIGGSRNICPSQSSYWEQGLYNVDNGNKYNHNYRVRLKELLPCLPNTQYYVNTFETDSDYDIRFIIVGYDSTGNYTRNIGVIQNGGVITTNSNEYYLGVTLYSTSDNCPAQRFIDDINNGIIKPYICLNSELNKTFTPYTTVTLDENIVSEFSIEYLFSTDSLPAIGGVVSNILKLKLIKDVTVPSNFTTQTIKPYVGVKLNNGFYERIPLGVFIPNVDSIVKTDKTISMDCTDILTYTGEMEYETSLNFPTNIKSVLNDIATNYNLKFVNINGLPDAVMKVKPNGNVRSVLCDIAELISRNCFVNRYGYIDFKYLSDTNFNITGDNYIEFKLTSDTDVTISQLTCQKTEEQGGDISYGNTNGFTMTFSNDSITTVDELSVVYNKFLPLTYTPYNLKLQGMPHIDVGDKIIITDINNVDRVIPVLYHKLSFNGGLISEMKADVPQSTTTQTGSVGGNSISQAVRKIYSDVEIVQNVIAGNITADNIKANSITADKLVTGTLTAESGVFANGCIGNLQLDRATANKIQIETGDIKNASITTAKIADANITTAKIADGNITSAKIADGNITTAKIQTGAITTALIGTGAVQTAQIADGSITDAKIVSLTANKLTAGTIDASNINVINLNADNLTVGTINGQRIADNAISATKLADNAVTSEKISNIPEGYNLVINSDFSDSDGNPINDGWVVSPQGISGSIVVATNPKTGKYAYQNTSGKSTWVFSQKPIPIQFDRTYIAEGYFKTISGSTGRVFLAVKLLDANMSNITGDGTWWYYAYNAGNPPSEFTYAYGIFGAGTSKTFPSNARYMQIGFILNYNGGDSIHQVQGLRIREVIESAYIKDASITTAKIADASITNAKIANVDASKITTGYLSADRINAGSITGDKIAFNTITGDKLVADTITAREIASKTITANEIASNTITAGSAIIADGAITTAKIADASITNAKIADASITTAKIANATIDTANIKDGSITDAKIVNLTANKLTAGTIDASQINVINLNANNITTGYLTADRIQGGILTLGGLNNGNGSLNVYSEDGVLISNIDKNGIKIKDNALYVADDFTDYEWFSGEEYTYESGTIYGADSIKIKSSLVLDEFGITYDGYRPGYGPWYGYFGMLRDVGNNNDDFFPWYHPTITGQYFEIRDDYTNNTFVSISNQSDNAPVTIYTDTQIKGNLKVDGSMYQSGFSTTNTSSSNANKWTKIASLTISKQYEDCDFIAMLNTNNNGSRSTWSAMLHCRLKQQNAMGDVPYVMVNGHIYDGFVADDFKAVTVQNDTSATVVEIYVKNRMTYNIISVNPIHVYGNVEFYSNQELLSTLPTGTQTNFVASNFTGSTGYFNKMILSDGIYNSTGEIKIINSTATSLTLAGSANCGIELGRTDGVASTPFIDFHGGTTAVDYDGRIILSDIDTLEIRGAKLNGTMGFAGLGRSPAYTWSGTINYNTYVIITHNLGYNPIIQTSGSQGNLVLTFLNLDSNNTRVYNHNGAYNNWTGTIYFW